MAQAANQELVDRFEEFYRRYYSDDVAELARKYPRETKSLHLDWRDLYQMDPDLADDYINHPDDLREAAEEALRLYDLPVDVSLGQAHVRVFGLDEHTEIREIRAEHLNTLVSVQGMVRKATDVRPKIERAVFVCQRCGAETEVPQGDAGFQEPYQCESCERQGPFKLDPERSEFVDSQKLRIQESPEGLAGGETPQSIDVHVSDDITGEVTPGDHVTVAGVLRLDQSEGSNESPVFDLYMEGTSVVIEDEEFEEMNITEEDKQQIVEISNRENIYEQMVDSMAPSIYGHREAKLAMILQLFSGVTKHLPDESRIRGDLHMLLIGDPGTGKCLDGDTHVTLADGTERPIRDIVEENLENPKPVDDGVYDDIDIELPSLSPDGTLTQRRATRVWKREAPETMYEVRTESALELTVTPSHPLFIHGARGPEAVRAEDLEEGEPVAVAPKASQTGQFATDGGRVVEQVDNKIRAGSPTVDWDRIESIETVEPAEEWVYDLEVEGTHAYLSNGVVSHNSALISYVQNIAPRSVYTSGKGSSSAGLTAAAVRDDFGDGQQWTLEAGALVLADQGVAAVDELDKMAADDRSAMHEALEQQKISISKAGINATLKARCSLLGAANPKYGRFDQYEPIGEQIDLEPALISRFDLIFTVTDEPDPEEDAQLAQHILQTNYAGELNTQQNQLASANHTEDEVSAETDNVAPAIDASLLRKYIAYSRRNCYPTMTDEARDAIEEFYVDLRAEGQGEDSPVPVTARQLEALVRLGEASARVRLSDTVEKEDAERVIEIVRSCLQDIGVDPETGEYDADVVETGRSKTQRDRVKNVKAIIKEIEDEFDEGAPVEEVLDRAEEVGMDASKAEHEIEKLKEKGELYQPNKDHLRAI
ncbi:ATP-dependent DNA helicase MCM (intein-containing) [Halobacterium hubeiense]|jgi:replicative DNA helicase Mcm|uniref:DNA helicase n=1 Tax=Halobacterium hubeiense TaxID=1407499 RepID=A0A0U5D0Q0_9EURY|nr:ATP-binding protein [Halobacterium hubeiense]CQH61535.1 ATP-dependent DNA helicase MCM (intein-containing) [Halobacterium hubeiense]